METKYHGYLTLKQQDELVAQLNAVGSEQEKNALKFPVVSWRNPEPLNRADAYQIMCIAYAFLLTAGSSVEEFEREIENPSFWDGYRVTHEVAEEDFELNAIHFLKCYCVDRESPINAQVRLQIFRLIVSLVNTFGMTERELVRRFKEDLEIVQEDLVI